MNEENKVQGWYDTTERREWYRQYSVRQESPAVPEAPPKKKRHTGMKVTMIVICVLVLIAASALAFGGGTGKEKNASLSQSSPDPVQSPLIIPGYDDSFSLDPFGGGYGNYDDYEDFRDYFNDYYTTDDTLSGSKIARAETGTGVTLPIESTEGLEKLSLQELYEKCSSWVVGISAGYSESEPASWGSGIIMTKDGYILTNQHIIDEMSYASVVLSDGTEYEARVVGEDTQSDIAVLKIEATDLPAAEFGDSSALVVGDDVVAIGNPLGSDLTGTMTNGIISAINRNITYNGHLMTLLQTNAAINSGNSGGPLFNMYGQVIGITNMKMNSSYFSTTIEGIGFAIPVSSFKAVVDQLIDEGQVSGRPGIGITCGAVPTAAAQNYGLPEGVYISAVTEGSDAYAKGLQEGDVITAINGESVRTTDDVNNIKDRFGVGDVLTMTIFRDGESFDVDVILCDMNELF